MRILILSQEFPPAAGIGGIGSYAETIAPALAQRGHDVHVLSCRRDQEESDTLIDGAWVHRRRLLAFRGLGRLSKLSPSAIRQLQLAVTCFRAGRELGIEFDVVESPEWMAEGLFFALRRRWPVVIHLHTPSRLLAHYGGWPRGSDLRRSDRLERFLAGRASVCTSPSRLLDEYLRAQGWMKRPATIIPYPMDTAGWADHNDEPLLTQPIVLFVGRLEYRKAPEVLVDAAARLRDQVPGVQAVFIGRSSGTRDHIPYGEWTAKMAEDVNAPSRFVGWVPRGELPRWYRDARVVAVPSRFESYSMTALEAMAAGRPVVYSSQVGAGEVLAGSAGGTEVVPDDPGALAEALLPYLADPGTAEASGRVAGEAVRRICAPDRIAAMREDCYERVKAAFTATVQR